VETARRRGDDDLGRENRSGHRGQACSHAHQRNAILAKITHFRMHWLLLLELSSQSSMSYTGNGNEFSE
jgi:hypothetical protein